MLDKILATGKSGLDYTAKLSRFTSSISKEKSIRGFGVALILMALALQLVAAFMPHKISAAPSQNDLIPGGVTSKWELLKDCDNNTNHIDKILNYYNIKCVDIAKSDVVSLNSLDYGGHLYSAGHLAYGFPSETPVNIGDETIYWRLLHAWDTNASSTYTAIKFTNADGKTFWMLFTCGNLVSVGLPKPPPPPPPPCPYNSAIPASSPECKPPPKPCPYNPALPISSPLCKPCASANSQNDALACLVYHKTVLNKTENIANANGTSAKPGDVLIYNLTVTNAGKLKAQNFVIKDNIADILVYANLTDKGGGTYTATSGILSFPAVDIAPGATATETFSVTVKSADKLPPPPTATSRTEDPMTYDDTMTNVYGDKIDVKVQRPGTQVVLVTASTSLPNTGPGSSIAVYALIAIVAGYFYSNRRLQLKEAKIAMSLAGDESGASND